MPRSLCMITQLPLFLLVFSLSCAAKPVAEAPEQAAGFPRVEPQPFRIVLASPREAAGIAGMPEGMLTVLNLEVGRLSASGSTWKAMVSLTEDETVRAVIVADAPQGTAALFSELKQLRPDLLLLALSPVEPPLIIQAAADVVLDFDHAIRAYSAVQIAARMKRSSIISLTLPGENDDWRMNARQAVLRATSVDMGMAFETLAVNPDDLERALKDLGMEARTGSGAKTDLDSRLETWSGASGSVVVASDKRLASVALRMALATKALFIELDRPENGYSGLADEVGLLNGLTGEDPVRSMIDAARSVPGQPGLALVWPGGQSLLLELGSLAFARAILGGRTANDASLITAMNAIWPAGRWHASYFVDPQSGVRARNHLLTGADPFLAGRTYLSSESRNMPTKYRQITAQ